MKGIVLAGGHGTRLLPLTRVTNKHLLPVYNKPMIYHPIMTLVHAGITNIMIVSGKGHAGHFLELLGSGKDFGCKFSYEVQEEAGGIAQALGLCEDYADNEDIAVILGDNLFTDQEKITEAVHTFPQQKGGMIFLKEVPDAQRFGVATLEGDRVIKIIEKPEQPESPYAVTGLYLYDANVFRIISGLTPSGRGELEITDVNNAYIEKGAMRYALLQGDWTDAGTFPSLMRATLIAAQNEKAFDNPLLGDVLKKIKED